MNRTRVALLAFGVLAVVGCVYAMTRNPETIAGVDAAVPSSIVSTVASLASSVAMVAEDAQVVPAEASVAEGDAAPTATTDAAVAHAEAGADGGKTGGPVVTVDESSAGKTIDLAKGQKLVVSLKAKPGSGFDWAVTKAPAALGTPEKTFDGGGDGLDPIGQRKLTFTVKDGLGKDEQAVELGYARSFEPGKPAFRTFAFKVRAAR